MKFRSIAVMVLIALTASIVLSACGGGSAPTSSGRTVAIETSEFLFTPDKVEAKVGEKLTFKITNKGTLDHSLVVVNADGSVLARVDVKLGGTASLDFTPSKAGQYQIICDVPGHKDSGMVGVLDVK